MTANRYSIINIWINRVIIDIHLHKFIVGYIDNIVVEI